MVMIVGGAWCGLTSCIRTRPSGPQDSCPARADIVAAVLTTGAGADTVGIVEMRTAVAAGIALRNAVSVSGGVNVEARSGALDQALVLDCVADGLDGQLGEREPFEADEHVEPLLQRALERSGDFGPVGGGALVCVRVPAHAVVDAAVVCDELVGDPVLVLEAIGVLLESLLPDLVEGGDHGRGRVPGRGFGNGGTRGQVAGKEGLGSLVGAEALLAANVLDGWVCQRTHSEGRSGQELKLDHDEVKNE